MTRRPSASPAPPEASPGLALSVLRAEADLDRLEPAWWALFRRCPSATPFQSPAWLIPWWRHFRPGGLLTLAVHAGRDLVALLPAYLEDGPHGRRLLPLGIGPSDHLDILLDPNREGAAEALMAGVAAQRADFAVLDLDDLAPDAAAWRLPLPPGARETVADQVACPVLPLPRQVAGPQDLIASRQRRKLALARNRAERRGGAAVATATDPAACAALFERLRVLHAARWEGRGEAGMLADPAVLGFHREAVPRLARAGLARFHAVAIGGEGAAVIYALHDGRRSYAYLSGFHPDFAFESPGVIAMAAALEKAHADGARSFHFLRGQEPYKYAWGAVDVWNRRRSLRWD
ncbi:GNAT family N-acetyltransferase [Methylobacterium sp. JK268]